MYVEENTNLWIDGFVKSITSEDIIYEGIYNEGLFKEGQGELFDGEIIKNGKSTRFIKFNWTTLKRHPKAILLGIAASFMFLFTVTLILDFCKTSFSTGTNKHIRHRHNHKKRN
ncbi:hypothetical protein DID80_05245 [Candidatus Marinamargulisbacteria bacterium SCGC AAA071-K20]|nr:hypothetical protein DID80_05245 [Candidatus Marinamargulisbacteria bacterium SCGC AAA071-K20]